MLLLLVPLLVLEAGLPAALYLARNRLLFFPDRTPAEAGRAWFGEGVEAALVAVRRRDGRALEAFDVRPAGAAAGGPVLLYLHGNAGCIADRGPLAGRLARGTGMRVFLVGYSGYGGNAGSPSEAEAVEDGRAAFDHLAASGVPAGRILLYGESIGGAVALAVAAERRPAGVVVQSSFSSLSSMALRVYPWLPLAALLVRGEFRSVDRIREYGGPVLVVHGTRDSIVPLAEAEALAAAGGERATLLRVEGADHNDLLDVGGAEVLARIRGWVTGTEPGSLSSPVSPLPPSRKR